MNLYPKHGKIPRGYNKVGRLDPSRAEEVSRAWEAKNGAIEKILRKHNVKTVLDLTCGTGSQVLYLAKRGYEVVGADVNPGPLRVARKRARKAKLRIKFQLGDMRTIKAGQFDAAISIWNAVGHLTRAGFEKAMRNIYRNLNDRGIYLFDLENLTYVQDRNLIKNFSFEKIGIEGGIKYRVLQHSIVNDKGILYFYTTRYEQRGRGRLKRIMTVGTHQLYTAKELRYMLVRSGFKVLAQYGMTNSKFTKFSNKKSASIWTVAQKR
jgi:ubiquinone/menaquinone biosynthesis C-methylase UbiE